MIKDPSGLLIGHYTPTSVILAEVAHLSSSFDHKYKDDANGKDSSIKLMAKQIIDTVTVQSALEHSQKEILNFTNNGIYSAQKGIYKNVVQIDTHSQLPTFMYYLGLMDKKHEQLFLRKKEIENAPGYKSDPKLIEEREAIKLELNIYCSTNDTDKGRYVNRLAAMYSGMNFIFDSMHYWGLSNVLNCVNDGYILQIKDDGDFNKQYQDFKQQWQSEFPLLTFSKKYWKYAIINGTQDYILINGSNDYKCRSSQLSVKAFYRQATGKSLDELKQSEVDDDALKYAKEKEKVAMMTLYNNLFSSMEPSLYGSYGKLENLNETKEILDKAGVTEANFLPVKQHYYSLSLDEENEQNKKYINDFTKSVLEGQLFMTTEILSSRVNLMKQLINVKEVNPDDYANANRVVIVNNFIPSIIDSIEKGQSIESWVKNEAEEIEKSEEDKLYQYNLLALIAQIYANEHNKNPNSVLKLVNKLRTTKYLKKLDMGEIIANDPRTLIVDKQLMVKDKRNIYTAKSSVVNHLLKEHFNLQQKQHFTSEKNNTLALLEDEKYQDSLDQGFKSDFQSILLDKNGNIKIDSPFKHKISHHVNVNYNPSIVNDPAYEQLNSFLNHLAPNQTKQLKAMLGLIPLQGTNIMEEINTFFILKGVSGAGKSTLARLLKGIFDDDDQVDSNIVSSTQNVNKAFTDERYVDLNDVKKGKIMLWFDDFQADSKSSIITASTGTVINGVIGDAPLTGAAKYEKQHPVKLPKLIVIATNVMPQVIQVGTATRMFVIDCPNVLKNKSIKDRNKKSVNITDFVSNPKVKEALFYLIMQEASKILKMDSKQRDALFDRSRSAATNLSRLSDSFLAFLEKNEITSPYDFVGMQAIKLFEVYNKQCNSYNVSYRSFTDQLEMLGLHLKRKNFGGKTYQKVICANSTQLTSAKMRIMRDNFDVYPDCVEKWDGFKRMTIGELKTWHYGFNDLKEKYDKNKDTIMFKPFDFSERG